MYPSEQDLLCAVLRCLFLPQKHATSRCPRSGHAAAALRNSCLSRTCREHVRHTWCVPCMCRGCLTDYARKYLAGAEADFVLSGIRAQCRSPASYRLSALWGNLADGTLSAVESSALKVQSTFNSQSLSTLFKL